MATESSAVVQFINTAQREHHKLRDSSVGLPDFTDDLNPLRRRYRVPFLVAGLFLCAVAAAAAGLLVGKHFFGRGPSAGGAAAARPARAAAPAGGVAAAIASAPAAPLPAASPRAPAAGTAPAQVGRSIAPEVLTATGFDIRVVPPATINLDGQLVGTAPLRVRNLTPGPHVIDVQAPAGYFSRRVEVELDAGEPQNVNLALDPIEQSPEAGPVRAPARREHKHAHRRSHGSRRGAAASDGSSARSARADMGRLMIGSKPPCDIYIDGVATGLKTPQRAIELAPGSHRVTLINAQLDIKRSFRVRIDPGRSTRSITDLTGKL